MSTKLPGRSIDDEEMSFEDSQSLGEFSETDSQGVSSESDSADEDELAEKIKKELNIKEVSDIEASIAKEKENNHSDSDDSEKEEKAEKIKANLSTVNTQPVDNKPKEKSKAQEITPTYNMGDKKSDTTTARSQTTANFPGDPATNLTVTNPNQPSKNKENSSASTSEDDTSDDGSNEGAEPPVKAQDLTGKELLKQRDEEERAQKVKLLMERKEARKKEKQDEKKIYFNLIRRRRT